MQHSALPLPEGSELRQGLRQLRFQWAAASACLLAITILGSNSAARRGSAELGGGASMVAKAAEEGAKPARMMSMSEIQAHATAKAHVAHKAASHKTRKGPNEHAASFADEAHPNAKLVKLLNQKAATYQKAGEGQLRAAQHKQAAAAVDKKAAQKELASAAHMKMEAKNDKKRSAAVRKSFAESEKPTLQANKAMKAADKTYRHDILAMASLYPQIGQDQATGKAVPAALEAQLKNVTAHLKADQAEKKKDGQLLASAASAQSTNYNENEGSSPENLVDQSTVYGLSQDEKDEVAKAKHSMSLVEKRMEKGKQEEVVAKRVLGVAHCIQKHALIYSYDENKEQHVEAAYQRILDQCDA
mmetsp:Transcript_52685/g.85254  ORF Transcript_52685/g.85254 Transcript_52685/m.85254 type:complete len:359 (+) Transcript_52685:129-1205(+)|eukprot:CAMPEP_0179430356 /NCGR_PEP_ID=MMETSP0799-20121207/15521_1 /TAXON_ID=46947 /ORGANISM="Geminigera cryophila, Strain CCMP2564" /LENGTH=358 /DNA_ID=CAMNT_0021206755 /DNA_START=107 /DNA_END=1183 /DNA_ORIENTATION=-